MGANHQQLFFIVSLFPLIMCNCTSRIVGSSTKGPYFVCVWFRVGFRSQSTFIELSGQEKRAVRTQSNPLDVSLQASFAGPWGYITVTSWVLAGSSIS